jgi:hypothetical protein
MVAVWIGAGVAICVALWVANNSSKNKPKS